MNTTKRKDMSLLFWYRLDSDFNDYSGNGRNLLNSTDPVSITTISGWTAADFGSVYDDKYLRLESTSVPPELKANYSSFTLSFRVYSSVSLPGWFFSIGSSGLSKIVLAINENKNVTLETNNLKTLTQDALPSGSWNNIVLVYKKDDPSGFLGSSTVKIYINGVLRGGYNKNLTLADTDMRLGDDITDSSQNWGGRMLDVRAYDFPFTADNVTNLYNGGVLYENFTSLTATMYTHLADLSWIPLPNVSSYNLRRITNGGPEEEIRSSIAEGSYVLYDIIPSSSYVFNVYSDDDPTTPLASTTGTSPLVDTASTSLLMSRLSNDLSVLPQSSIDEFDSLLRDVLQTGDKVTLKNGEEFVFVEDSGALIAVSNVLTPFSQTSGSSQAITLNVNGNDKSISYDETKNEVTLDGVTAGSGEYFVLDNYKVVVEEI